MDSEEVRTTMHHVIVKSLSFSSIQDNDMKRLNHEREGFFHERIKADMSRTCAKSEEFEHAERQPFEVSMLVAVRVD